MNLPKLWLAFLTLSGVISAGGPDWPRAENHAVTLLQQYVRIKSVNPPADTSEAARFLQKELAAYGLDAQLYKPDGNASGKTNLLVRLSGRDHSKRPLLLLNHMDVVPADASRWKENPFGGEIKGNEI